MLAVAENMEQAVDSPPIPNAVSAQAESTVHQQDSLQTLNARAAVQRLHRVLRAQRIKTRVFAQAVTGTTALLTLLARRSAV